MSLRPELFMSSLMALGVLGGGCIQEPPSPTVTSVTPDWAFNQEKTDLIVLGDNLLPGLRADARSRDEHEVIDRYEAALEPVAGGEPASLTEVRLLDVGRVSASVPVGLEPGVYELVLTTPYGDQARSPDTFDVLDRRASALEVLVDQVSYEAFDQAIATVRLVDVSDAPFAQDLGVRVELSRADGKLVDAEFAPGSLDDQVVSAEGTSISGRLGEDGLAQVAFSVGEPMVVTLRAVATADPDQIKSDDAVIQFRSGTAAGVQFELLLPAGGAQAGVPFDFVATLVDVNGNELLDVTEVVAFGDTCNSYATIAPVEGSVRLSWTPRAATGTALCPVMAIRATNSDLLSDSDTFSVSAGPVDHLEVVVSSPELVAGEDLHAFITPVDALGNPTTLSGPLTSLRDAQGVELPHDCTSTLPIFCELSLTRAGADQVLVVEDGAGIQGQSAPFDVLPGAPVGVSVLPTPGVWTAGEDVAVVLRIEDAWGNPHRPDVVDVEDVDLDDLLHEVECTWAFDDTTDRIWWCRLFTAISENQLTVTLPTLDVGGGSPLFDVQNGPMAVIDVAASVTTAQAGQSFPVTVTATDAYGNPWVIQDDPQLSLSDGSAEIHPSTVQLGPTGSATMAVTLFRSGQDRVFEVRSSGGVTGWSDPIDVSPSAPSRLSVELDRPWAFVSEAGTDVQVAVVDEWGNVVTAYSGAASITSRTLHGDPVTVVLSAGFGSVKFVWDDPVSEDYLDAATPDALSGSTGRLLIVKDCDWQGPSARIRFGLSAYGLACAPDARTPVDIAASLSGSLPGSGHSLALFAVQVDGGASTISTSSSLTVTLPGAGSFLATALAAQDDLCGAEVSAPIYAGPDDGQPVGPLEIALGSSVIDIGSNSTTVTVDDARTCRNTPASLGEVYLRTTRGSFSGLISTGTGLLMVLDPAGHGVATLSAHGVDSGGLADITATVESGTASGAAGVSMIGDHRRPIVWWQDPKGETRGGVEEIRLHFSERLDPATVVPSSFGFVPLGSAAVGGVTLNDVGDEVLITLASPLAAGDSTTLLASVALEDRAGNPLAGTWAGTSAPYLGQLGTGASVDAVTSCSRAPERFRPDGDPGPGEEADEVVLNFSSASGPAWWVVQVLSAEGTLVREEHLPVTGSAGSWSWDGRDAGGGVLGVGSWRLRVQGESAYGDLGTACERTVDLDQRVGP